MIETGVIVMTIVLCICLFLVLFTVSYMLLCHILNKIMEYWFYKFERVTTNELVLNKEYYKSIGINTNKLVASIEIIPFCQEDIKFEFNDIYISSYENVKLVNVQDGPCIWKRRWDREYIGSRLYSNRPEEASITIVTSDRNLLDHVEMLMYEKTRFNISVLEPDGSTHIRINNVVITKEVFDGNTHYITGDFSTFLNTKI